MTIKKKKLQRKEMHPRGMTKKKLQNLVIRSQFPGGKKKKKNPTLEKSDRT